MLIDLQNGIVGMPLAPRSGADVVEAGMCLARVATVDGIAPEGRSTTA